MNMDLDLKIFRNVNADLSGHPLTPEEAFLISRIDTPITIRNLIQISGLPRDKTTELIQKLLQNNVIEISEQRETPQTEEPVSQDEGLYSYEDIFEDADLAQTRKADHTDAAPKSAEPVDYNHDPEMIQTTQKDTVDILNESAVIQEQTPKQKALKRSKTGEMYQHETGYKFKLGMKAKRAGDFLGAERFISAALSLSPKISHYWWHLALVQVELKKIEEAEESCIAALQLDPKNRDYLKTLALIQKDLGKTDEANKTLKKLAAVSPADLELVKTIQSSASGWVNKLKGLLKM